jgi:PAS domain-containing protein
MSLSEQTEEPHAATRSPRRQRPTSTACGPVRKACGARCAEASGRLTGRLRERAAVAARLALILDSLPAAVVVVDAAGRVLQLSGQAAPQVTRGIAG